MDEIKLRLVQGAPLRYLMTVPSQTGAPVGKLRPVLCFLHGYDEGWPTKIEAGLTKHGPFRRGNPLRVISNFIVVAPQMPARGDLWHYFADGVHQIVQEVRHTHGGDPNRTYLTGFSFGANGVFDLALHNPDFWAALWAVDPTRTPLHDPNRPIWLSLGEIARFGKERFIRVLNLVSAEKGIEADRVYLDEGADHVGSATRAYADKRIYSWLLLKQLA